MKQYISNIHNEINGSGSGLCRLQVLYSNIDEYLTIRFTRKDINYLKCKGKLSNIQKYDDAKIMRFENDLLEKLDRAREEFCWV
jgi:hypothetical protein